MKIVHIIDSMDFAKGGPPQVCAHLMLEQSQQNKVSVMAYDAPAYQSEFQRLNDLPHHIVTPYDSVEKLFAKRSSKLLDECAAGAGVLHLHNIWEPLLVAAGRWANENSIPYVITPHGMLDPWCMQQKKLKKQVALTFGRRRLLQNAKFIHALNEEEVRGIRKLGIENRFEIVPNGISIDTASKQNGDQNFVEAFPDISDHQFVLFLGRLHFKKGLDILALAAEPFLQRNPDWRLVVAGPDDGAEAEFRSSIKRLGIENQVVLTGPVFGPLKHSLLSKCSIFCLPSRQEGFSVAILEAMLASKPVVISEHCHFNEVATTQSGIVEKLDAVPISNALIRLADSESQRTSMGQNGKSLVKSKYTWNTISQKLVSLYTA